MKIFFISIFIGLGIVLLVKDYPGYVLINYPPWVFETALPVFVLLLIAGYFLSNYLLRVIGTFLFVRKKWGFWQKRRLGLRAQAALALGLMKNWSGQWQEAEKLLIRSAQYSAYPALHLIGAAFAAHHQSRYTKRDRFLEMAKQHVSEKEITNVEYTHAELYAESGELDKAIDLLKEIQNSFPRHIRVARLLALCLHKQGNWKSLWVQIKHMRHYKMIDKLNFKDLEVETIYQLLDRNNDQASVDEMWDQIPRHLRQHERLLPLYIRHLNNKGESVQAEVLLSKALKTNWNEVFIELYGLTPGAKMNKQLQLVEKWINNHPKNPVLLHTAARLCITNRLWGKARSYLEASLGIEPTQVRYKELGDLLEHMGDAQGSLGCYRKGLKLSTSNSLIINGQFSPDQDNRELRVIPKEIEGHHEDAKALAKPADKLLVSSSKD